MVVTTEEMAVLSTWMAALADLIKTVTSMVQYVQVVVAIHYCKRLQVLMLQPMVVLIATWLHSECLLRHLLPSLHHPIHSVVNHFMFSLIVIHWSTITYGTLVMAVASALLKTRHIPIKTLVRITLN